MLSLPTISEPFECILARCRSRAIRHELLLLQPLCIDGRLQQQLKSRSIHYSSFSRRKTTKRKGDEIGRGPQTHLMYTCISTLGRFPRRFHAPERIFGHLKSDDSGKDHGGNLLLHHSILPLLRIFARPKYTKWSVFLLCGYCNTPVEHSIFF